MCFFDDNDFDDCYFDDDRHVDLPNEVTEDDINDVVAFLNSMTLGDWEKLRKDVKEELINDMCDDCDTFIFVV